MVLVGACGMPFATGPRPPAAPPRETTLGLTITTRTLPSGLRVVVVTDPHATEVQVTTRYQVGAVDDGPHPGIAHLVEHLMFQQVPNPGDGQPMFSRLEDDASYFNGATTYDTTTYMARAPATGDDGTGSSRPGSAAEGQRGVLDELLSMEALRLEQRCTSIGELAFLHEREVVANELRQRDQSAEIFAAIHGALYPKGHPYRASVGGTLDSIAAITRDQACSFIDTYYAPNNAVLVLSGNLSPAEVDQALGALTLQISKRVGAVANRIQPVPLRPMQVEASAPIDDDVLVLAWPLPTDPVTQAKVRAIEAALPGFVDAQIKGSVTSIELGDARAPMLGLAMQPADDESFQDATRGTRRGIENLPSVFRSAEDGAAGLDDAAFERIKQRAIYATYASLEDASERDTRFASYVLAGRDPRAALEAELAGLRELTRDEGAELVARYLSATTPTVVNLKAGNAHRHGGKTAVRAPLHDMGPRRTTVDAALAKRPAEHAPVAALDVRTRQLPNGLKIVLLPDSAVPTFDARIVFGAGTADEPADERGVALLAAHTLTWDLHYMRDLAAFVAAGGMRDHDVNRDRTTFSVQGLDQNLDRVLAGLRRWVRDGTYDDSAASYVRAIRHASKGADDQGPLTDAWRAALFGAHHPYVDAGVARHTSTQLTLADAQRFRGTHYTPDNATLVISGRFDVAAANRWVDYLFADWAGHAVIRASPRGTAKPAALAKVDDISLVQVRLALQATAPRAQALVVAEMLDEVAHDVRYSLGASYTFGASLAETRLSQLYLVAGWIEASRVVVSVQLIRDRMRELRADGPAAMRAFVLARRRVLNRLRSQAASASGLAGAVDSDIELGRPAMSGAATTAEVEALTFADLTAALADLDLPRATVLMDGPAGEIAQAFGALGRKPSYIDGGTIGAGPSATAAAFDGSEQHVPVADTLPALTDQPPPRVIGVVTSSLVAASSPAAGDESGYAIGASVAYRLTWVDAIGLHAELGALHGQGDPAAHPVELSAVLHRDGKWWGEAMAGLHVEALAPAGAPTTWHAGPYWGLTVGVDLLSLGVHRVGLAASLVKSVESQLDYTALSVGVVFRPLAGKVSR
jgi:zinc protease